MLGSELPGEAEAARGKLRDHLRHHKLTFLDMAMHVSGSGRTSADARLEREIASTRAAKEEAARTVAFASTRLREMEAQIQKLQGDLGDAHQTERRLRALTAAGWGLLVMIGIISFAPNLFNSSNWLRQRSEARPTIDLNGPVVAQMRTAPAQDDVSMHLLPGERAGRAAVQDLPVRLSPNDDATVRAFLNQGEHVAIQQQVRNNSGQTWLLIRSGTGTGWARAGDVLH